MRWCASYGFLRLVFSALWCRFVFGCSGAGEQIAVCLHVYLERDFVEVEPYLDLTGSQDRRVLISGPEADSLCQKYKMMVDCYAELDGQCHLLSERKRLSYLIHTLFTFHEWMCGEDLKMKLLMEHIPCILRVQQRPKACKLDLMPNVWQRMLRLEETEEETCPALHAQLTCLRQNRLVQKHCGNASQQMFETAMEMWFDGWCADYSSASYTIASLWTLVISLTVYIMDSQF